MINYIAVNQTSILGPHFALMIWPGNNQLQRQGSPTRTRFACEYCRKRKTKCDGPKPMCLVCEYHVTCIYVVDRPTRREKYWDKDYVQSLEEQVDSLSRALETLQMVYSSASSRMELQSIPRPLQSSRVFDPRISGDTMPVFAGPSHFSVVSQMVLPTFEGDTSFTLLPKSPDIASFAADIKPNIQLKKLLKKYFLDNINIFYNFVDPAWLDSSDLFPHNDNVLQLFYSAIDTSKECYHKRLCLPNKYYRFDTMKGNILLHMAAGLSTHLEIQETQQLKDTPNELPAIRTFWSLYLAERTSTPKLGLASYSTVVPPEVIDISILAFEHHSLLFHQQIDKSLYLGAKPRNHPIQVVFWISYYATLINIYRPLLDPDIPDMGHDVHLYFRTATSAARSIVRLIKVLLSADELKNIPPFVGVCVLRTALVHALSMISVEVGDEQQSKRKFWLCVWALGEYSQYWPNLGNRYMSFLMQTARGLNM
ncbi:hypothetical protein F5Y19DRAFT_466240 [Xylariaceae sp. FL1651]|nr:hypothetical protein F5Y19DRAFT_466240 [Xylariaceae sp. FL1651]